MKRLVLGAAIGTTIGVVFAVGVLVGGKLPHEDDSDLHSTLHKVLPLKFTERATLENRLQEFLDARARLDDQVRSAQDDLASAIDADPDWTSSIDTLSMKLETALVRRHRETVQKLVQMREGLPVPLRSTFDRALVDSLRDSARRSRVPPASLT